MGVKSTVRLTRDEAEQKYVDLNEVKILRQLKSIAVAMDDEELENTLESLNDKANDGEGFENYLITRI